MFYGVDLYNEKNHTFTLNLIYVYLLLILEVMMTIYAHMFYLHIYVILLEFI